MPMIITSLFFIMGMVIIHLHKKLSFDVNVFFQVAATILSWFIVSEMIRKYRPNGDPYLLPLSIFLTSIGLVMIYRLKSILFLPQLKWEFIGLTVFFFTAVGLKKINRFVSYKYLIGFFGVGLLVASIIFGTDIGGSRSWIILGSIRFQPSEFAKLFIIVFLAAYLVEHQKVLSLPNTKIGLLVLPPFRFIAPLIVIWGMAMLMFVLQRDLGAALLFFGIAVVMTFIATGNLSYVFLASLFFGGSSVLSYYWFSHVKVRIAIWMNPWLDPNGQAYQIIQSLFSFGSGGIVGTGLAAGHPEFIPEVHTDFIFSAIAEELGLLGTIGIILVYILLFYRGFKIALACNHPMNALLAAGLSVSLALQAFIIIAGVTKFLPLTGITMPFISYGGSSMITNFIMIGLLFALSVRENDNA